MKTQTLLGLCTLLLLVLFIGACSKKSVEEQRPSASSSISNAEMTELATAWALKDKSRRAISGALPTGSMLPTLDSKAVLMFEKIDDSTVLKIGDIIGTKDKVMHRLAHIDGNQLVLRGDNNNGDDAPIPRSHAEWRLVGILYTNGQ